MNRKASSDTPGFAALWLPLGRRFWPILPAQVSPASIAGLRQSLNISNQGGLRQRRGIARRSGHALSRLSSRRTHSWRWDFIPSSTPHGPPPSALTPTRAARTRIANTASAPLAASRWSFWRSFSLQFDGFSCSPVGFEPILLAQVSRAGIAGLRQPLNISRHLVRTARPPTGASGRRGGSRRVRGILPRTTNHIAVELRQIAEGVKQTRWSLFRRER